MQQFKENNRGITLVMLLIYLILTVMMLGLLTTLTLNFRSNFNNMNVQTVHDIEFDKLNVQLLKETKNSENNITVLNKSTISFTNGNTYEYIPMDEAIYLNNNIKIADKVEKCEFSINNKETELDNEIIEEQLLTVVVQIDGKERTTEYSLLKKDKVHVLEYIESTGEQCINTQIMPDQNTEFELSIALNNVSDTQAIMGSRIAPVNVTYNLIFYNGALRWDYYNQQANANVTYHPGSNITITKKGTTTEIDVDGQKVSISDTTTPFTSQFSMYVFTLHQPEGSISGANMKLYYFKIYKNSALIRDYIPALDANNVPCLYDKVTNQYFYNIGSGEFNYKEKETS